MIDEKMLIEHLRAVQDSEYDENRDDDYFQGLDAGFERAIGIVNKQPKVNEWIPFTFDEDDMLNCPLPDAEEEILISDGEDVWLDIFMTDVENENTVFYLDNSNCDLRGKAWMPLPNPHVKGASEND